MGDHFFEGGAFAPTENEIVLLLGQIAQDPNNFDHDYIEPRRVFELDPQELFDSGTSTGNRLRWFFSSLENGSRQTPGGGSWTFQRRDDIGNGDAEERSFIYDDDGDDQWRMKEYKLEGSEWALYCVYKRN